MLKEKHLVLIAMQILWARQGNPHRGSQKAVLTDLGAHGAGGEQHDQRIILVRAELMQRSAELLQTLQNWTRLMRRVLHESGRRGSLSDAHGVTMASDPAEVVFQNPPALLATTNQIQPVDQTPAMVGSKETLQVWLPER